VLVVSDEASDEFDGRVDGRSEAGKHKTRHVLTLDKMAGADGLVPWEERCGWSMRGRVTT
jgi:hypothetical protein